MIMVKGALGNLSAKPPKGVAPLDLNATQLSDHNATCIWSLGAAVLALSSDAWAQSGRFASQSPGFLEGLDTTEFGLTIALVIAVPVAIHFLREAVWRPRRLQIQQHTGWRKRKRAVLRESISRHFPHANIPKLEQEHKDLFALLGPPGEVLVGEDRALEIRREIEELDQTIAFYRMVAEEPCFQLWNLTVPKHAVWWAQYLTPFSYIRRRATAIKAGNYKGEGVRFKDGTYLPLTRKEYLDVVALATDAGWTMDLLRERLGTFDLIIQKKTGMLGFPETILRSLYNAGIAQILTMRGPQENQKAGFQDLEGRRKSQRKMAHTLRSYFIEGSFSQKPFDTPTARVHDSNGDWLAICSQVTTVERDYEERLLVDPQALRPELDQIVFQEAEHSDLTEHFMWQMKELSDQGYLASVLHLGAQCGWFQGFFDSNLWYRGYENNVQTAISIENVDKEPPPMDEIHIAEALNSEAIGPKGRNPDDHARGFETNESYAQSLKPRDRKAFNRGKSYYDDLRRQMAS